MTEQSREYGEGLYALCAEEALSGDVLEELDAPGEYFYDKANKRLYLYPNGTIEDMTTVLLSQQENLIEVGGGRP